MSIKDFKVDHNRENNQFRTMVNNEKAYLNYRKKGNNTLEYYKTFVPDKEREQEVSSELVREALTFAKQNNLKVDPSCPYVKSYINKNMEFKDLMVSS